MWSTCKGLIRRMAQGVLRLWGRPVEPPQPPRRVPSSLPPSVRRALRRQRARKPREGGLRAAA